MAINIRPGLKCIVPFCTNNKRDNPTLHFSTFPDNLEKRRKWLQVIGVEELLYLSSLTLCRFRYVCFEHFSQRQRAKKRLKKYAVPDILNEDICPLSDFLVAQYPFSTTPVVEMESEFVHVDISAIAKSRLKRKTPLDFEITDLTNDSDDSNDDRLIAALDDSILSFWSNALEKAKKTKYDDMKKPLLPIARIKRIMKIDDTVKTVGMETTVLFAMAAELFIEELTLRGWAHVKKTTKNTLYRADIVRAVSRYEQFDFLMDIVPQKGIAQKKKEVQDLGIPDVMCYFSTTPREAEVKKLSPRQIAVRVGDNDENDNNECNRTETFQKGASLAEPMEITVVDTSTKNEKIEQSRMAVNVENSQAVPFQFGAVEIFEGIVLPSGDIQHISLPQLQPFFIPQTTDVNYEPLAFQDATSLAVTLPSHPLEIQQLTVMDDTQH